MRTEARLDKRTASLYAAEVNLKYRNQFFPNAIVSCRQLDGLFKLSCGLVLFERGNTYSSFDIRHHIQPGLYKF